MIAGASRGEHVVPDGWHLLARMVPSVCSPTFLHASVYLSSFSARCPRKLWERKRE